MFCILGFFLMQKKEDILGEYKIKLCSTLQEKTQKHENLKIDTKLQKLSRNEHSV